MMPTSFFPANTNPLILHTLIHIPSKRYHLKSRLMKPNTPQYTSDVINEWNYTSPSLVFLYGVHSDFIFTLHVT